MGGLVFPVRETRQSREPLGSRHPVRMGRLEWFHTLTLCFSNKMRQILSMLRRVCGREGR